MTSERIQWTGDTSTVAFVFDFVGDDIDNIKFAAYLEYELKAPGALEELQNHYWEHEGEWKNNEVQLTDNQIVTLNVYIDCVNEWFVRDRNFMLGMNARWRINHLLKEWDLTDQDGLKQLEDADDWWRTSVGQIYISDAIERVEDALGEDSYLAQKFQELTLDELFELLFDFYIEEGPYDYEILGFTDDDGEIDIPEEDLDSTNNFLASNTLLVDFHDATKRYRADLATENGKQ